MSTATAIRIDSPASPRKLRDGSWGIAGRSHRAAKGDIVEATVRTRGGKTWTGAYRVIWAAKGEFLAADAARRSTTRRSSSRSAAWECPDDEEMHRRGICCCPRR